MESDLALNGLGTSSATGVADVTPLTLEDLESHEGDSLSLLLYLICPTDLWDRGAQDKLIRRLDKEALSGHRSPYQHRLQTGSWCFHDVFGLCSSVRLWYRLNACTRLFAVVSHLFAQSGNLGRWLDRRAGSPGVIIGYFLFWRSVVFSDAYAAQAFALAGASDTSLR